MTPWDLPWPRLFRYMKTEHGIEKAEVRKMTDYELDCWMRPSDQRMRQEIERRDDRASVVQDLMRRDGLLPKKKRR